MMDISQQIIHGSRNQALWVGSIISEVFGISSPIYLPWGSDKSELPAYEDVQFISGEEGEELSVLGTPVFGIVTFEGGTYNVYDRASGQVKKVKYDDYTLPYSCICDFLRENNVITTNVLGNTGTVKELFGIGDWNISIRGIAVNGGNKYKNNAHEQIATLIERANICDAIGVNGPVFANKDISRMVIKSVKIQPIEAKYNVIPFQIEAVSDEPIELIL
jgi:hypothetical protein